MSEVNTVKADSKMQENVIKAKKKKPNKLIAYILIILLITIITNPDIIPFMPSFIAEFLNNSIGSMLGDMSGIAEILSFDFAGIIQVFVMILVLLALKEILIIIFNLIKPSTSRGQTLHQLAKSSVQYIIVIFGIFWGLSLLGVNITTLFASAGILALIIGFGAESLIADVITGAFLIIENQFNVDDIIEIEGYRGVVTHIGLRTTNVKDTSGNEKIFNNSDIRNIINLSIDDSYAICDITIAYSANLDKARDTTILLMQNLAEENYTMFKKVPEFLGVQELTNEGVVLRVKANVSEKDRFDAARKINWTLKEGLQNAGMGVPHSSELVVIGG